MQLEAFRIENYKKIRDTDWISCQTLTAFVGKNEAGKSATLRGLSKLNPSDGEKYDGLKEFPRRRYSDEFGLFDWPAASARFVLDEKEREAIGNLHVRLRVVKKVEVTRHYSSKLTVNFIPNPDMGPVALIDLKNAIDRAIQQVRDLVAPDGMGDRVGVIKEAALKSLEQSKPTGANNYATETQVSQVVNAIALIANEDWSKQILDPVMQPLRKLFEQAVTEERLSTAKKWVETHLPKFVYFNRLDVIENAIHLPSFMQDLARIPNDPQVRAKSCLFKHVGLDIKKLSDLGRHPPGSAEDKRIRREIDERAILASSASTAMTEKFAGWWEQRKHKFRYQLDGDYFRISVSDDLDPSEIELDQRSAGMQYFFSFYTVFTVESEGAHANSILVLDDPGLYLHGTAQAKAVEFLEKLSRDNQVLYSTHSPFMISADHLERARAVYEAEDGTTKISEDVWPKDRDSLFPLQAALGYNLAQSLFVSKRQLIVEGLTDFWLLKALDYALISAGRKHLAPEIVVVPSAGISKLLPLASMLIGHDVEIAALLDGDEPARKEGKKLQDKLLSGTDRKVLFVGDFANKTSAELEDIFPEPDYLSAVKEAYPDVDLKLSQEEMGIDGVVNKVDAFFLRSKLGHFEKWKAASVLRDRVIGSTGTVPSSTLDISERIFQSVNANFGLEVNGQTKLAREIEA
jgi:hypothetical protein